MSTETGEINQEKPDRLETDVTQQLPPSAMKAGASWEIVVRKEVLEDEMGGFSSAFVLPLV